MNLSDQDPLSIWAISATLVLRSFYDVPLGDRLRRMNLPLYRRLRDLLGEALHLIDELRSATNEEEIRSRELHGVPFAPPGMASAQLGYLVAMSREISSKVDQAFKVFHDRQACDTSQEHPVYAYIRKDDKGQQYLEFECLGGAPTKPREKGRVDGWQVNDLVR